MRRTALTIAALSLACCSTDECREYSDYTCKQIEKARYNVWFYFPDSDGRGYYLGETEGLRQCGAVARDYAAEKSLTENGDWGYVCCMIAKGSSCYEKHR